MLIPCRNPFASNLLKREKKTFFFFIQSIWSKGPLVVAASDSHASVCGGKILDKPSINRSKFVRLGHSFHPYLLLQSTRLIFMQMRRLADFLPLNQYVWVWMAIWNRQWCMWYIYHMNRHIVFVAFWSENDLLDFSVLPKSVTLIATVSIHWRIGRSRDAFSSMGLCFVLRWIRQ